MRFQQGAPYKTTVVYYIKEQLFSIRVDVNHVAILIHAGLLDLLQLFLAHPLQFVGVGNLHVNASICLYHLDLRRLHLILCSPFVSLFNCLTLGLQNYTREKKKPALLQFWLR